MSTTSPQSSRSSVLPGEARTGSVLRDPLTIAVVGAVAAASIGGGVYEINKAWGHHQHAKANKQVFTEVKDVLDQAFILKSGAVVRFSPAFRPSDGSTGNPGNVSEKIKLGSELLVDRPLEYVDGTGDVWLGFNSETDSNSYQDRAVHTRWINQTELNAQGNYIQTVSHGGKDTDATVGVIITADGAIATSDTQRVIASAGQAMTIQPEQRVLFDLPQPQ